MLKVRFVVLGFASHQKWAEGYQRATSHDVQLEIVPCDKWKWRMQAGAMEFEATVTEDVDILVVDGMFDVAPLVALLRSRPRCPSILVYLHENQLKTPFTEQDRDKRNNTHWHYGLAHWRSLMAADGFVFNSKQHFDVFADALPKLINQQCPRDTVEWHLRQAECRLKTRCTVLHYGLELDELLTEVPRIPIPISQNPRSSTDESLPILLWNARLEEDKDPSTFLEILADFRTRQRFRLVVLGTDPSNGEKWSTRIHREFAEELVFLGWCTELADYARWLQTASVVISTAQHETFGISIVESVFCGALPLLPRRLSYPELFPPNEFPEHFYSSPSECVLKLLKLLSISADPLQRTRATAKTKHAVARFRWQTMSRVYDNFFLAIADGNGVTAARQISDSMIREEVSLLTSLVGAENADRCTSGDANDTCSFDQVVTKADDPRVALYRPKSLRDHEYQKQLCTLQEAGLEPSLHGGRRAMTRMLEAMMTGSRIVAVSFLATAELAEKVLTQESRTKCQAPVYVADKKVLDTIRGQKLNAGDAILAMVQFPIASPLSDLIANPPILVLEDVRYADNAGSILRTAFCLGISSIVASGTAWAALQDSRSARCSMGTIYFHRFYKADASCSLDSILALIRENGICIYGIEIGQDAVPIEPHGHDRKWAAILGNEDDGLTPEIRKACDKVVFVPQAHGDSINVGHAAAISMFELGRLAPLPNHDGRATCT